MVNLIHRKYCRSVRWRAQLSQLLPWATAGNPLRGATVLELGSGPGLTTDWLRPRVGALATVEYDESDTEALRRRLPTSVSGVQAGVASWRSVRGQ
jgi:16S rRNA A1518/A1519 N6-dimethyltransferase RsmA/KsgA/DIM1 with predicted DNA glycosylase/AP lyase activity